MTSLEWASSAGRSVFIDGIRSWRSDTDERTELQEHIRGSIATQADDLSTSVVWRPTSTQGEASRRPRVRSLVIRARSHRPQANRIRTKLFRGYQTIRAIVGTGFPPARIALAYDRTA